MKLKKIFTFVIALVVCLSLAACGGKKKCEHRDANDDLKCDKCGEAYEDGPEQTQHTCADNNGDNKCDECGKDMGGQQVGVYAPKWDLNPTGWKGNGMNVKIKCLPVSEFDPFDAAYSGDSQEIRMRHQQLVQQAYDIKIKYVAYDDSEAWGPTRVSKIVESFTNGSYQEQDIYVVNISSNWIPTIVKSGALAELASIKNGNVTGGILANFNEKEEKYVQDSTINEALSASNKVFGISTGKATPDQFIYYNVALVEAAGVEDPAELWMKGEWTLSKFKEWVAETQSNLPEGKFVLDMGYPEFTIGMVASTGNRLVSVSPIQKVNLLEQGVTDVLKTIQTFYADGYYNARGSQDVTDQFIAGDTVLHSGSFWFIKADDRFNAQVNNLRLGIVPYPAADGDNIAVEYTSDAEEAILGANGEPLMKDGQYVAGLDLSGAAFAIPFASTTCYSVLDYSNGKNGINAEIVANILIDLYAGQGADPNQTEQITDEQGFRIYLETLFNREIDIEVVMSTYNSTYYELFESVSMTVGGGSHFGPDAFWPLCGTICKDASIDPYTKLNEVYEKYRQAMIDMGYNPR